MPTPAQTPFADRLAAAIDRTGSIACVGLDPVLEKLPPACTTGCDAPSAIHSFCDGILQAVVGLVPVVKFQSACFERYGPPGLAALNASISHARSLGLITILDAKRGDIGISAEHYAHAAFVTAQADALTVNPYLGMETLEPYLAVGGPARGLFVLVRTSNPGSDALQSLALTDGRTVGEAVGGMVAAVGRKSLGANGLSSVGAVVGATKAADATRLRAAMPDQVFLVPGYGAQGGQAEDVRPMLRTGKTPSSRALLVTASRSVIYPIGEARSPVWTENVRTAADNLNREIAQILN
ncbi:MAG: orotidine-5'-phosphate decarboxylase [Phycisphaerales bacterium]|nr:orotidine-5'-phosphate decarboxylase [Phycisphaerales bacterium]